MTISQLAVGQSEIFNPLTSGCPVTSPLDFGESTHASNLTFKIQMVYLTSEENLLQIKASKKIGHNNNS
jgi:hypothetical protein